ncbi:hypothetical protein TNCT_369931 [Trichonephila clavata]|uniref:Uncharacterized protein n=1 Tax=Trichonephila clavata TaxID=2740835 RepID=A0A8X6HUM3_TRICU|nr:hypothetical protein TNCT_369931 [Trichonephila clavata]
MDGRNREDFDKNGKPGHNPWLFWRWCLYDDELFDTCHEFLIDMRLGKLRNGFCAEWCVNEITGCGGKMSS